MIGFMFTGNHHYTKDDLKESISILKLYFIFSKYGQKELFKISVIQVHSIKFIYTWMQVLFLHK